MNEVNNLKTVETQALNIHVVMHRVLLWWNELPNFGAKNATFDEARFKSKGGLTQIYHPNKFPSWLTNEEIVTIYEKHGV